MSKSDLSETGLPCILYGQLYTTYLSETIDEIASKTNRLDDSIERSQIGDLIIPCSGETPEDIATARCVMVPDVLYGGDLNVLRSKHHDCSFLSYQLNGKRRMDIAKIAVGKTIVHLHGSDLKSLRVWVPSSLEEERKIASLLNLLNKRIAVQNKIIDDKKREIKVLNDLLYRQTIKKHFRFADISKCYAGLFGKSADDFGEGMPYITYLNVLNNRYIDPSQCGYVSVKDGKSQNSLLYGDVVLTLSSETPQEVGVASVYLESGIAYLNSFCTILRFDGENVICSEYATWLFSTTAFRKHIYPFAQGSTRYNLNLGSFMQSQFAIPRIDSQKKIGHMLNGLAQMVRIEERELSRLYQMKKFLLNGLFI